MPLLLTKTIRDLRHRTLRSALTLLGIVIGVAGGRRLGRQAKRSQDADSLP